MRDGDFAQQFAQAGSMVGIRVGQHHVLKRDERSKMLLEVGDEGFTAVRGSAIDDHKLVGGQIAVADNDGVPRTTAVTDGQEFNLTQHDALGVERALRDAASTLLRNRV